MLLLLMLMLRHRIRVAEIFFAQPFVGMAARCVFDSYNCGVLNIIAYGSAITLILVPDKIIWKIKLEIWLLSDFDFSYLKLSWHEKRTKCQGLHWFTTAFVRILISSKKKHLLNDLSLYQRFIFIYFVQQHRKQNNQTDKRVWNIEWYTVQSHTEKINKMKPYDSYDANKINDYT